MAGPAQHSSPVLRRFPRRTAAKARTRARILEAARRLFAAPGYDSATMAAIAEAADVHVATVFSHFRTKRHLFEAILACAGDWLEEAIESARGRVRFLAFWTDLVRAAARAHARQEQASLALAAAAQRHPDLLPAWLSYERRQIALFEGWIAAETGLDPARDARPRTVAAMLVSAGILTHQRWTAAPGAFDLEEEAERMIAAVCAILASGMPGLDPSIVRADLPQR